MCPALALPVHTHTHTTAVPFGLNRSPSSVVIQCETAWLNASACAFVVAVGHSPPGSTSEPNHCFLLHFSIESKVWRSSVLWSRPSKRVKLIDLVKWVSEWWWPVFDWKTWGQCRDLANWRWRKSMRLIVPAPSPDVGAMRRQATSSLTNPAPLVARTTSSSSTSSSPVNIVNYRRLYNDCDG